MINLLTSFNDIEDGAAGLVYSVQTNTNPSLVTTSISGGNLTLAYTANGNGTANITIKGTDTGSLYVETTFTVTVNAVNDNPVTTGILNVTVNEDSANTVISLLTFFNDIEDGAAGLVYSVQTNTNPSLVNTGISGGNLTLAYTANANGSANITIRGTDSGGLYAETTFTVTVNTGSDAPTTTGISNVTVNEDSANTVINLLTSFNDTEDGAAGLVYSVQTNTNPSLVNTGISGGNLTLAYTANANGSANITIRGTDSGGLYAETAFTVTVNAGSDAPTTTGIANVTVNEDSANSVINLLTSFNDVEDGATGLVYSVQSNTNPSLVNASISGGNITLAYTANGNGTANITVRGTDKGGLYAETTFTVTVNAGSDTPTTTGISNITVNEDSADTVINLLTSFNDTEDGATWLVYTVQSNTNPSLVTTGISGGNLTLSYTADANGTANITVRGTDKGGLYAETTFTVTVNAGSDTPTTTGISNITVNEDSADTVINLLTSFNDTEDGATWLVYTVQSNTNPSLVTTGISGGNLTLSYTADANGTSNITVRGTDKGGLYAETTFTVTVNAGSDTPTTTGISNVTVNEDSANTVINLLTSFNDTEDGASGLVYSVQSNTNPSLVNASISGGNITLAYTANGNGTANITVRGTDKGGLYAETIFTVTVNAINDIPAISDIKDQATDEDIPAGATVFTVGDIETPAGSLILSAIFSNQTLLPDANISFGGADANRTITMIPAANQNGTATITVTVNDGTVSVSDTFVLTVNPVDDAPVILNPVADVIVDEDASDTVINLSNLFTDIDNDVTAIIRAVKSNSNPLLLSAKIEGDILTLNYSPNQNGTAEIIISGTSKRTDC